MKTLGLFSGNAQHGRKFVLPSIEEAEALQGFAAGWTAPAQDAKRNGPRWKLVGNAVTTGVADWLVGRLLDPGEVVVKSTRWACEGRWPDAAYGQADKVWSCDATQWPLERPYRHLTDVVNVDEATPLSQRATAGFLERASRSTLRFDDEFLANLRMHLRARPVPIAR